MSLETRLLVSGLAHEAKVVLCRDQVLEIRQALLQASSFRAFGLVACLIHLIYTYL